MDKLKESDEWDEKSLEELLKMSRPIEAVFIDRRKEKKDEVQR